MFPEIEDKTGAPVWVWAIFIALVAFIAYVEYSYDVMVAEEGARKAIQQSKEAR